MAVPYDIDPGDDPGGGGGGWGGGTGSVNIGTTIFSATFNKQEAASALRVIAYASVQSPDDLIFTGYLTINGVVQQNAAVNVILDNSTSRGAMPITLPAFVQGLGAGQHTIVFSIRNRETAGSLNVLAGSTMEIAELKQAAV